MFAFWQVSSSTKKNVPLKQKRMFSPSQCRTESLLVRLRWTAIYLGVSWKNDGKAIFNVTNNPHRLNHWRYLWSILRGGAFRAFKTRSRSLQVILTPKKSKDKKRKLGMAKCLNQKKRWSLIPLVFRYNWPFLFGAWNVMYHWLCDYV